ncbi:hypothetical protein T439DRAFT_355514 [Meredithblackwellia eburnea MCA 4105]
MSLRVTFVNDDEDGLSRLGPPILPFDLDPPVSWVTDASNAPPLDFADAAEIYRCVCERRTGFDVLLWSVPATGFAAQAFLFTTALAGDSARSARLISMGLSILLSLLTLQLFVRQLAAEDADRRWLDDWEARHQLSKDDRSHGDVWEEYQKSVPSPAKHLRFATRASAFTFWAHGILAFGVAALVVLVLVAYEPSSRIFEASIQSSILAIRLLPTAEDEVSGVLRRFNTLNTLAGNFPLSEIPGFRDIIVNWIFDVKVAFYSCVGFSTIGVFGLIGCLLLWPFGLWVYAIYLLIQGAVGAYKVWQVIQEAIKIENTFMKGCQLVPKLMPFNCDKVEDWLHVKSYQIGGAVILFQSLTLICVLVLIKRANGCPCCKRSNNKDGDDGSTDKKGGSGDNDESDTKEKALGTRSGRRSRRRRRARKAGFSGQEATEDIEMQKMERGEVGVTGDIDSGDDEDQQQRMSLLPMPEGRARRGDRSRQSGMQRDGYAERWRGVTGMDEASAWRRRGSSEAVDEVQQDGPPEAGRRTSNDSDESLALSDAEIRLERRSLDQSRM